MLDTQKTRLEDQKVQNIILTSYRLLVKIVHVGWTYQSFYWKKKKQKTTKQVRKKPSAVEHRVHTRLFEY